MSRISPSDKKIIKNYVLVTGGSGGIGSEICKELSKLGYYSIMCYSKNFEDITKLKKNKFIIPLKIKLDNNNSINKAFKSLQSIIRKDDKFENIILCASPQPIILPILKCNSKEFLKHFSNSLINICMQFNNNFDEKTKQLMTERNTRIEGTKPKNTIK